MIPIRAEGRRVGRPWLVWLLAIACAAVLVRLALLPDERASAVVDALAVVPERFLAAPLAPAQLVTLVTSAFLHAGWVHLAANLLYLIVFGPIVLAHLGWRRFAALWLAAGAFGALVHTLQEPSSTMPLVGASAAIAGVLGALIVVEPHSRVTTVVPVVVFVEVAVLPAGFVIALWFLLQVASALAPVATDAAATAWYAHLGGFAIGALAGLLHAATGGRETRSRPPAKSAAASRRNGRRLL